jgi:hypothetical protein
MKSFRIPWYVFLPMMIPLSYVIVEYVNPLLERLKISEQSQRLCDSAIIWLVVTAWYIFGRGRFKTARERVPAIIVFGCLYLIVVGSVIILRMTGHQFPIRGWDAISSSAKMAAIVYIVAELVLAYWRKARNRGHRKE